MQGTTVYGGNDYHFTIYRNNKIDKLCQKRKCLLVYFYNKRRDKFIQEEGLKDSEIFYLGTYCKSKWRAEIL